jgi:hypothetical protein
MKKEKASQLKGIFSHPKAHALKRGIKIEVVATLFYDVLRETAVL